MTEIELSVLSRQCLSRRIADQTTFTFFEYDSEIDRAFADGLTAEEVYDRVIDYYNQKIDELKNGHHYNTAAALQSNRDHLCAPSVHPKWGDKKARIV